ncbi:hypothetical protein ACFX2I_029866 [Malus domestica]|nr:uncharacterized protein LOC114824179 [Malus domestica]
MSYSLFYFKHAIFKHESGFDLGVRVVTDDVLLDPVGGVRLGLGDGGEELAGEVDGDFDVKFKKSWNTARLELKALTYSKPWIFRCCTTLCADRGFQVRKRPPPSRRPPHPHLCVLLAVSCILVALICILLLICSSRRPLPRLHVTDLLREFSKDSIRLVKRCHKPDRKEFSKVALRTAIGFVVMGFVGFFVKLIFIPINNIIVGSV